MLDVGSSSPQEKNSRDHLCYSESDRVVRPVAFLFAENLLK